MATGAVGISWLKDNLQVIDDPAETEALARSVPDCAGVYFVPAFTGLLAPHWREDARGTILGLTAFSTKAHIVRAMLEALCFQSRDVLDAMEKDAGVAIQVSGRRPLEEARGGRAAGGDGGLTPRHLQSLRVDGGACRNDFLMEMQADLLNIPVIRGKDPDTTARGAALAAGVAAGFWTEDEVFAVDAKAGGTVFAPSIPAEERARRLDQWGEAVGRSLNWEIAAAT